MAFQDDVSSQFAMSIGPLGHWVIGPLGGCQVTMRDPLSRLVPVDSERLA